ncbi:hypothetical protein B0H17DRAFT_698054 [Mycena rosella]|uniref:Uncharacterized protein n=1 Tax=Mycena rosella TaxID=1033263 RepID=A0AAD7GTF7_MYCRO|nr:hypothetical protein B0H17DRAFT_698054 [Mycena rosella]
MHFIRAARPRVAWSFRLKAIRAICRLNPSALIPRAVSRLPSSRAFFRASSTSQAESNSILWPWGKDVHGPNCTCQEDPTARLKDTLLTLVESNQKMDPASATEADLTYLLQYLKSADIPADEETSCAHTVAQFQAQTALDFLTRILESNPSSLTVRRIIQAWPDIDKWIDYTFHEWVRGGKFTARKNWGRVNGFNTIIPFLAAVAKVPEVADLLVADSRRTSIFEILAFCWNIEADEWFVKEKRYDPSITAAYPFCALAMTRVHFTLDLLFREEPSADTIMSFPGLDFMKIFESVRDGLGRTSADTARTAIALLASNNRVPLRTLDAHIDILGTLDPIAGCTDALPAQHCVRHMTRVLSDLMQKPYDADCAPQMTRCISMCIHYLVQNVPTKDGYSNARMAVLAGVLPALLRSQSWLAPGGSGGYENAVKLFQLIGLYIVYPSVLRPLLVAARKIDELGIVDPTQPFGQLYNNLMHLVADRLALVRPVDDRHIDLSVKCNNATVRIQSAAQRRYF